MPLSINDGKGTPQAHVFTQDAQQNGADPAEFVNRANVNGPSFWERLTGLLAIAKPKTSKPHVYKLRLSRPIAGVDSNSQPIVVDTHEVILTLLIGQKAASEADILDSLVMLANLADNATVRTQVKQMAPLLIP
jgi:hypothetical protein